MDKKVRDFYLDLVAKHGEDSVVVTDADGVVEWANGAFERLSGYPVAEMIGKKPGELLQGPETSPETAREIGQALRNRQPIVTEILNYTKSGAPYWIEISVKPIFDANGKHTHFMSVEHDITRRRALEQQTRDALAAETARRSERKLISQATEWFFAAKTQEDLTKFVAKCLSKLFPDAQGQLYIYSNSRDVLDLQVNWCGGGDSPHMDADECWGLRRGRAYSYGISEIEFPCNHVSDDAPPYFCLPLIAHGDTLGLLHLEFPALAGTGMTPAQLKQHMEGRWEVALIISEQVSLAIANAKLRQELQDQSTRDALTGLWNRRWFWDVGRKELHRAQSRDGDFALISLDVDHFKTFNDHHGHDAGDVVLRQVGTLMEEIFADGVSPCRIGGEEFIVLCGGKNAQEAHSLAERFRVGVSDIVVRYGDAQLPPITVSAGIAAYPEDGADLKELVKAADGALYAAKEQGRDCVVLHQEMTAPATAIAAE